MSKLSILDGLYMVKFSVQFGKSGLELHLHSLKKYQTFWNFVEWSNFCDLFMHPGGPKKNVSDSLLIFLHKSAFETLNNLNSQYESFWSFLKSSWRFSVAQ